MIFIPKHFFQISFISFSFLKAYLHVLFCEKGKTKELLLSSTNLPTYTLQLTLQITNSFLTIENQVTEDSYKAQVILV